MHVYVVIEQPLTSLLFRYKPVFLALQKVGAQKISLQLGDFGAASAKPTALYGTAPWLQTLKHKATQIHKKFKKRRADPVARPSLLITIMVGSLANARL